MKKLISIVLSALVALSLTACAALTPAQNPAGTSNPEGTQPQSEIPNPLEQQAAAEAFKALGITMDAPDFATDVTYYTIGGKIAEVIFTFGGAEYTYRAALGDEDISGVYDTFTQAFTMQMQREADVIPVSAVTGAEGGTLVTWAADGVSYSLYTASGVDEASLRTLVIALMGLSFENISEAVPQNQVVEFIKDSPAVLDFNGDGKLETVTFESFSPGDMYLDHTKVKISSENGAEAEFMTDMQYFGSGYACDIDGDGLMEVFVSGDTCSNDYSTWMFRFDGEKIINGDGCYDGQYDENLQVATPSCSGAVCGIDTEKSAVIICDNVDILGTMGCTTEFVITAPFALTRAEGSVWTNYASGDEVDADYWTYCTLVTVRELPYVADGTGETVMLPVGEAIVVLDTDGETYVHFMSKSGIMGTVTTARATDENDWGFYIDGVKEDEYFESVPYAG